MIFNEFIFAPFLVFVLAAFALLRGMARVWLLIAASMLFYGVSGIEHLAVLAASIGWVWCLTRSAAWARQPAVLALAVAGPMAALVWYKYAGFLWAMVAPGHAGGRETFSLFSDVLLPAGISFFTFQLVSFAIDRYRGQVPAMPPLSDFALYVSFFPQLVAGPILRFDQVREAIAAVGRFRPDRTDISDAFGYIAIGFAWKVLIADGLANSLGPLVADPASLPLSGAAYVVLAYSFQIYFDFYGYSLIAIGLGRLFGFRFPDNFARPYSAPDPRAFWRRWHITLSWWIRDYLYLPLGGNRHYARNIVIVFAVAGLWHGAGWTFIAWGLWHAVLVVAYHLTAPAWDTLPRLVRKILTFILVSLGWLLFLFDWKELAEFANAVAAPAPEGGVLTPGFGMWIWVALAAFICWGVRPERLATARPQLLIGRLGWNVGLAVAMVASVLFLDRSQTFIYFRF